MNQLFNLNRFGMLFKKHTIENLRSYAMSLFVLLGIVVITIGIIAHNTDEPIGIRQQIPVFVFFFLITGTIFTSNIFINLGDKRKAIATLTLPASAFEKFLVGWIYSFIFFQLIYTALFYFVLWSFLNLMPNPKGAPKEIINIFSTKDKLYLVYVFYTILHAIVIYGAIYFKRMHFIKTVFAFFVIILTIWLINDWAIQSMIHHVVSHNPPFSGLSFKEKHQYYNTDLPDESRKWILLLFFVLACIIWLASYFRLREKQI